MLNRTLYSRLMNCPICNRKLVEEDEVLICPAGHGTLMTGKLLGELRRLNVPDEAPTAKLPDDKKSLICPNCSKRMQKVNYNDTEIIIDACTNCPYRWLDAGEVEKIKDFKPKLSPEDLLFLEGLREKTATLTGRSATNDDPNPEVLLSSGVWGGAIRGGAAGDDRRTLGYLVGAATYGLIAGAFKSKFIRIIAPFVVIGFIILGYLIIRQIQIIISGK